MGLTALFGLYFFRWICAYMGNKYPNKRKMWFFISTLRMAFIVILFVPLPALTYFCRLPTRWRSPRG